MKHGSVSAVIPWTPGSWQAAHSVECPVESGTQIQSKAKVVRIMDSLFESHTDLCTIAYTLNKFPVWNIFQ
eukprot:5888234-Amphidinium_carterae.1